MTKSNSNEKDWLSQSVQNEAAADPGYAPFAAEYQLATAVVGARLASGLTQAQVAVAMGASQPQVARFERAPYRATVRTLLAYCLAVGVELRPALTEQIDGRGLSVAETQVTYGPK